MSFPLEKYRYYVHGNKVTAVSTYAGKTVRGTATCHPSDTFDLEKGKLVAAAKCNEKVAYRRMKRAYSKLKEADENFAKAQAALEKEADYYRESYVAYNEAAIEYDNLVKNL
jgi:hypothetical protein